MMTLEAGIMLIILIVMFGFLVWNKLPAWIVFIGALAVTMTLRLAPEGELLEGFASPAMAGLLFVIGFRTLKPGQVEMVWKTGMVSRVVMGITFISCLLIPLQYAVLIGVTMSLLLYVLLQSNKVTIKRRYVCKKKAMKVHLKGVSWLKKTYFSIFTTAIDQTVDNDIFIYGFTFMNQIIGNYALRIHTVPLEEEGSTSQAPAHSKWSRK
jgi:MFS superfamily sulfate permease-like transporter